MTRSREYLRTDDIEPELAQRTTRGGVFRIGGQAGKIFVFLATGVILARLLTPEDFGLYAMVVSLTGFVATFSDFGLPLAAVQRQELRQEHASALFWMAMLLSVLIGLFIALMAPVLARFYEEPEILVPTVVMAVALFGRGLGVLHEGLLIRRMRFGTLALVDTAAAIVGGVAGLSAALAGAAYWALVLQFLTTAVVRSGALWLACGWRPSRPVVGSDDRADDRSGGVREMVGYGGRYTAYRVLRHVGYNLDRVLVGHFIGASTMGLYDNSFRWSRYPQRLLSSPLLEVAVSGLSRVRDDPRAYRESCRGGFLPVFAVVLPIVAFMAADPRNVILVLLGSQWIDAVPLFRLLCLATYASVIVTVIHWLYLSTNETGRLLKWGLVSTPVKVAAVSLGVRWGAMGVAAGFTAATWLLAPGALWYCLRSSPLSMRDIGAIVWRPGFSSAIAALAIALVEMPWSGAAPLWQALANGVSFVAIYVACWVGLPGGRRATADVLDVGRRLRSELPRLAREREAA